MATVGDKGHFTLSAIKSVIRVIECLLLGMTQDVVWFAAFYGVAELFGLLEEVFDKR